MRVWLCWAHGTGKTTILKLFDRPKITEIARDAIGELWMSLNEMDFKTKIAFQQIIFWRQLQRERSMQDFISDRTVFDNLAYMSAIGDTEELKFMEERVKLHIEQNPYDFILYFPIEFPLEDDWLRYTGDEFQAEIDKRILFYLDKYGVKYYTVTGPVEERKKFIDATLNYENTWAPRNLLTPRYHLV